MFNLYAEYIMEHAGLEEAQAGIKIAGRNINNLRYADDTTLMAENEYHGIWSHHFMANRRATVETVSGFILGGSKITADGDCSQEIKRCLLLGRKGMASLNRVLKKRRYFADKGLPSQSYGFSSGHVWM